MTGISRLLVLLCAALLSTAVTAQRLMLAPPPPKDNVLAGVIDLHVHADPDVFARSIDDIEAAEMAKRNGMRALLLKNHVSESASRAWLVMKTVPGIELFGGIALNKSVGGVNPVAVEVVYRMSGGRGKVVWMPTFDSENDMRLNKAKGAESGLRVAVNGKLLPETEEVLKIMAREKLSLATGHIAPEESLAVIKRATELGIKNILVTHALSNVPGMTLAQAKEAAAMGALIEYCFGNDLRSPTAYLPSLRNSPRLSVKEAVAQAREIGFRSMVMSTDLGQFANPTPVDGMKLLIESLKREGVTQGELDLMLKKNPARFLGLEG
jgi:hypothetical protein